MERPKVTKEMIVEAAKKVASNCLDAGNTDIKVDDLAKCFRTNMDGYELAKELDRLGYYDLTKQDVDELDCMDSIVDDLRWAAEKKWVEENNIQPPLPIGTAIKQGVIRGVCSHTPARYLVKEYGCTRDDQFLLVKFEDAVSE